MKAFTDIEQSKKLAEILPIESADMHYATWTILENNEFIVSPNQGSTIKSLQEDYGNQIIPCWSLAALLQIMPHCIDDIYDLVLGKLSDNKGWYVMYDDIDHFVYLYIAKSDLIDACVEIILKLHEEKLL